MFARFLPAPWLAHVALARQRFFSVPGLSLFILRADLLPSDGLKQIALDGLLDRDLFQADIKF